MLKDRQKTILGAAVKEYIRTAKPVSSREVLKELEIVLSPATVRNDMLKLDELGYLEQPHTSAGRIPTDKGYRFFVDNLPNDLELSRREQATIRELFEIGDEEEFLREMCRNVSRLTRAFAAGGFFADDSPFYETGLSEILDEPEFQDWQSVKSFGYLADYLEEKVKNVFENFGEETDAIFIGKENPLKEARNYSMLVSSWKHPRGFKGFLTVISPKRTDYAKNKAVARKLKNFKND